MDDWESTAVAIQGVCVAFGGVAVLLDAFGVPGVVDPFALGAVLFAVGFALGGLAARARGDGTAVALHVGAVAGWAGVVAGGAFGPRVVTWTAVGVLALVGVGLCYRAVAAWRDGDGDDASVEAA